MKRNIIISSALFVGMLFLGSCVKEYTCQCVMTYSGQVGLPDPVTRDYPIKDTKKEAVNKCKANSKMYKDGAITTVEECELW